MRCRFASPDDPDERRALERFDSECRAFYTALGRRDFTELSAALARVHPHFEMLSLSGGSRAPHAEALELHVRSGIAWRPWLERFGQACPRAVRVTLERGPRPFHEVCASVRDSTGFDASKARVRAGVTRGHLLELVVYLPGAQGTNDTRAQAAAELIVEGCLGERVVDDWVLAIDALPLAGAGPLRLIQPGSDGPAGFPIAELRTAVERAIHGVVESLPVVPWCMAPPEDDWVLFEVQSEPAEELGDMRPGVSASERPDQSPAPAQSDLLFASTCVPELLKCYLEEAPFSSLRFSRHGERFAYLKYPTSGPPQTRVEQRRLLEDDLDGLLRDRCLGCVVGNGVGRGHCYVDVALLDIDAALPLLVGEARRRKLPRASWVLFCDSEWQFEWVGVWPDTPAPNVLSV